MKNWKTSLIGLVILLGLLFTAFTEGFGLTEAISAFIALGLLYAKDYDKSHYLSSTVDPDTKEYPDTKE